MRNLQVYLMLNVMVSLSGAVSAVGEDHFLSIGGGYSPTGNQVSLEKNVLMFQGLLARQHPEGVSHDIFFADGNDPARDLQFFDPASEVPRVHQLLAEVFQQTRHLDDQYRSSSIENVRGASSRENLQRWFDQQGPRLKPDDRLFLYVTAHGGRATDSKKPHNTVLYLWNAQRVTMQELATWLDKIDAQVPVVIVMVQCYAGGFADVIFHEGDPAKGFTAANRCGFFATVHDRGAAGCTADINEDDYHEYSTYFWAAIGGQTRTGQPIPPPDYDGDGA
ncbi:MAG: C13 family peptidase, partial [Planctomycetes bacterium]|nr:C13 family peptidase [Planctomycetota bacterium]